MFRRITTVTAAAAALTALTAALASPAHAAMLPRAGTVAATLAAHPPGHVELAAVPTALSTDVTTARPLAVRHHHPAGPLTPRAYARRLVGGQYGCVNAIFTRESGWRWNAENPSGAYGIPQALPGSKMATAGADWATNPLTQVRWGIGYMTARYGSPCAAWSFWEAHSWYLPGEGVRAAAVVSRSRAGAGPTCGPAPPAGMLPATFTSVLPGRAGTLTRMPFLIECRPGQGGDDAADFADVFAASIEAWARANAAVCFRQASDTGGTRSRSIDLIIDGVDAGELRWLGGTHRRQSVPRSKGDRAGRRHTSYMTVRVLDATPAGGLPDIPRHELRVMTRRGTGNGGQGINTTDSCVDVVDLVSGETASRSHGRSQQQNIASAVMELRRRRAAAAAAGRAVARNAERAEQSAPVVVFNHNRMRREVEHKPSGRKWGERAWQRGEFGTTDLPSPVTTR